MASALAHSCTAAPRITACAPSCHYFSSIPCNDHQYQVMLGTLGPVQTEITRFSGEKQSPLLVSSIPPAISMKTNSRHQYGSFHLSTPTLFSLLRHQVLSALQCPHKSKISPIKAVVSLLLNLVDLKSDQPEVPINQQHLMSPRVFKFFAIVIQKTFQINNLMQKRRG